jgi:hypothetical protein
MGPVPRAYEGIEGRKNTNKEIIKYEISIQNTKLKFKKPFFLISYTISLPVKREVCENNKFLSLYLAKGAIGV